MKIERAYSKEKILELYLNEIYLGLGAYGIAAASLIYFDKSVHELTVRRPAYLAALPKAPNNYHPFRQRERAIERRNYVIDRMVEDRYIKRPEAEKAKKEPLKVTPRRPARTSSRPNISPRRSAATSTRSTARRSSTRAASRCAPRSIPSCR